MNLAWKKKEMTKKEALKGMSGSILKFININQMERDNVCVSVPVISNCESSVNIEAESHSHQTESRLSEGQGRIPLVDVEVDTVTENITNTPNISSDHDMTLIPKPTVSQWKKI